MHVQFMVLQYYLLVAEGKKNSNYVMEQKCDTLHSIKSRADPRHVGTPDWHMPKVQIIFGESLSCVET